MVRDKSTFFTTDEKLKEFAKQLKSEFQLQQSFGYTLMRTEKQAICRQVITVEPSAPHVWDREREQVKQLCARYIPDAGEELTPADLDRLCRYYSLEHEVALDSYFEFMMEAVRAGRNSGSPEAHLEIEKIHAKWRQTPSGQYAQFVYCVVIAFADILCRNLSLRWAVVTDVYEQGLAVVNADDSFAVFPHYLVPAKDVCTRKGVWQDTFDLVRSELLTPPTEVEPVPLRSLAELAAEADEILAVMQDCRDRIDAFMTHWSAFVTNSARDGGSVPGSLAELSPEGQTLYERMQSIPQEFDLLVKRLRSLLPEIQAHQRQGLEAAIELEHRLNARLNEVTKSPKWP